MVPGDRTHVAAPGDRIDPMSEPDRPDTVPTATEPADPAPTATTTIDAAPSREPTAGPTAGPIEPDPSVEPSWWERSGRVALAVVGTAWVVVGLLILARPVFITHDSLSNNVHVWWIADQLWSGSGVPLRIDVLANGEALTFPYASIPWLTSALAWPLLGDRAVSLWLVLGFAGTVAATFWTFPSLRRGWWAVAVLTNPALVISPLLGQLPFLWSTTFTLLAMGCWHRGRRLLAVVMAVAAQVTHPAVTMPILAVVVLVWLPFERRDRRWPLLGCWMLSVVASLPAVWAVFQSPVVAQTTLLTQVAALFQTAGMRLLVVLVPLVLVGIQHQRRVRIPLWTPVVLSVLFVALQWPMYRPFGMDFGWGALRREPMADIDAFAASDGVVDGDTYRVLSGFDGKYGLYATARAGGVLDAEFFPEGLHRGPFASPRDYAAFLRERRVDHVVEFPSYGQRYRRSNEPSLLREMVAAGCVDGVAVSQVPGSGPWSLYDVRSGC